MENTRTRGFDFRAINLEALLKLSSFLSELCQRCCNDGTPYRRLQVWDACIIKDVRVMAQTSWMHVELEGSWQNLPSLTLASGKRWLNELSIFLGEIYYSHARDQFELAFAVDAKRMNHIEQLLVLTHDLGGLKHKPFIILAEGCQGDEGCGKTCKHESFSWSDYTNGLLIHELVRLRDQNCPFRFEIGNKL